MTDFQTHIRAAVMALYKLPDAERGPLLRQAIDSLEEVADNYPEPEVGDDDLECVRLTGMDRWELGDPGFYDD